MAISLENWVPGLLAASFNLYAALPMLAPNAVSTAACPESRRHPLLLVLNAVWLAYGAVSVDAILIAVCLVALTAYGFLPRRNATTNDAPDIGPKYQKSSLDKSEQQMILARLETLRATQHIHRQANLTLARLATAVRTTPHNLSQVLNTSAGGFHAWVAEARIEDARALLLAGPEFAVLEVAFQVGFNSKSAFYDAFKRATGQTPVAWLKDRREESELPLRDAT